MLNIRDIEIKKKRRDLFNPNLKLSLPLLCISIIFIFYIGYSFNLQIIKSNQYLVKASNLNISESIIEPQRGIIYDSNSVQLVKNVERFDIYLRKRNYSEIELKKLSLVFLKYLNIKQDELNIDLQKLQSHNSDIKIKENLSADVAINIQSDLNNSNNIYFKSVYKREYTYPLEFSHILGYTGGVTDADIQNGYNQTDQIGKYKLELQYESIIKGVKGKDISMGGVSVKDNSIPGDNIYLTINSQWQNAMYRILGNEVEANNTAGGGAVIVDDSTGDVKTLVSYPGFDTNLFINGISNDQYQQYLNNRERPLIDKAIGIGEAPGSIFKLITAYTLIQNNIIDRNTTFFSNRCINLGGVNNFCEYHQLYYGEENVVRALYKSSNLFFCHNSIVLQNKGEINKLIDAAALFGIGQKTGINLIGENSGNMDSPQYQKDKLGLGWYEGNTCNTAIGQGAVLTTPIQMAMVASIYPNKGILYQPNIINRITDSDGNVIFQSVPKIQRQIPIDQNTLDLVNEGMHDVAYNPQGTVYPFLHNLSDNIRAKTGTAEVYENVNGSQVYRTHGWVVGSFDFNGKTYSFALHMTYGGGGYYIGKTLQRFLLCLNSNFSANCDKV